MFPIRYFAGRFYALRYWPEVGAATAIATDINYLRTFLNDLSTAQTPTES